MSQKQATILNIFFDNIDADIISKIFNNITIVFCTKNIWMYRKSKLTLSIMERMRVCQWGQLWLLYNVDFFMFLLSHSVCIYVFSYHLFKRERIGFCICTNINFTFQCTSHWTSYSVRFSFSLEWINAMHTHAVSIGKETLWKIFRNFSAIDISLEHVLRYICVI